MIVFGGNGFGRFLCEENNSFALHGSQNFPDNLTPGSVVIICAGPRRNRSLNLEEIRYSGSNLINRILEHKPRRVVFVSSIDVFACEGSTSDDPVSGVNLEYASDKVLCEELLQKHAMTHCDFQYAIIRSGALVHPTMPSNNVLRMLKDPLPKLTLSSDSEFRFVSYESLMACILILVNEDIENNVVNFFPSAERAATLGFLADRLVPNKKIEFGSFTYGIDSALVPDPHELYRSCYSDPFEWFFCK